MVQAATRSCSNPSCDVAETGKCVEGLELSACPTFGKLVADLAQKAAIVQSEATTPQSVKLSSGERLNVEQVTSLLKAHASRVIAFIGPSDAGKTSLIAGIYERFQLGQCLTHDFVRSSTLYAFERACHHARAVSRRLKPSIDRTRIGGETAFYHLGLHQKDPQTAIDFFLADRAGEEYRQIMDDISTAYNFPELGRADVITMLLDGARLLDSDTRHVAKGEIRQMLQAFVDSDLSRSGQRLAFVLTKYDEIVASEVTDRAEQDFLSVVAQSKALFGGRFYSVATFRVAASPHNKSVGRGFGLDELLKFYSLPIPATKIELKDKLPPSRIFLQLKVDV